MCLSVTLIAIIFEIILDLEIKTFEFQNIVIHKYHISSIFIGKITYYVDKFQTVDIGITSEIPNFPVHLLKRHAPYVKLKIQFFQGLKVLK